MIYRYCSVFYENYVNYKNSDVILYPLHNDIWVVHHDIFYNYKYCDGDKPIYNLVYWIKGEFKNYYFKSDLYYKDKLISCGVIGDTIDKMLEIHLSYIFII